jgi:hypothetical protein
MARDPVAADDLVNRSDGRILQLKPFARSLTAWFHLETSKERHP